MQQKRFLTLPELLVVIRARHRLSVSAMAAYCGLDPERYAPLEHGRAPTRELFDTLVDGVPVLGAVLMGRKTAADDDLRQVIDQLHELPLDEQLLAIGRMRLELQWLGETRDQGPLLRSKANRRLHCRRHRTPENRR